MHDSKWHFVDLYLVPDGVYQSRRAVLSGRFLNMVSSIGVARAVIVDVYVFAALLRLA